MIVQTNGPLERNIKDKTILCSIDYKLNPSRTQCDSRAFDELFPVRGSSHPFSFPTLAFVMYENLQQYSSIFQAICWFCEEASLSIIQQGGKPISYHAESQETIQRSPFSFQTQQDLQQCTYLAKTWLSLSCTIIFLIKYHIWQFFFILEHTLRFDILKQSTASQLENTHFLIQLHPSKQSWLC